MKGCISVLSSGRSNLADHGFPLLAQVARSEVEYILCVGYSPALPRELQALLDDGSVGCLNGPRTDQPPVMAVAAVVHSVDVGLEVADQFSPLLPLAQRALPHLIEDCLPVALQ